MANSPEGLSKNPVCSPGRGTRLIDIYRPVCTAPCTDARPSGSALGLLVRASAGGNRRLQALRGQHSFWGQQRQQASDASPPASSVRNRARPRWCAAGKQCSWFSSCYTKEWGNGRVHPRNSGQINVTPCSAQQQAGPQAVSKCGQGLGGHAQRAQVVLPPLARRALADAWVRRAEGACVRGRKGDSTLSRVHAVAAAARQRASISPTMMATRTRRPPACLPACPPM